LAGSAVNLVVAQHVRPAAAGVATVELRLEDPDSIQRALAVARPDLVLHAGAWASQARCAKDPGLARRINADSVGQLFAGAQRWLLVSTDLVFDGRRPPYGEGAATNPLPVYGCVKLAAEQSAAAIGSGLVVRLPLLFGPSPDGASGATDMIRSAVARGASVTLFTDEFRCPLHAEVAARALVHLLLATAATGIVHLPGPERLSRHDLGVRFLRLAGLDPMSVRMGLRADLAGSEERPKDLALHSERLPELLPFGMPSLEQMLAQS
jgi:dTDP-4-dehydrorhamnose reductase